MKKHMLGIYLLSLLTAFSCGQTSTKEEGKVEISGKIGNAPERGGRAVSVYRLATKSFGYLGSV
jgi:hypothetical protein